VARVAPEVSTPLPTMWDGPFETRAVQSGR
jgi:hypothetical protein